MDQNWEAQLQSIWLKLGTISNEAFILLIKNHVELLTITDSQAIADFERACAFDSTGHEKEAEPLYRSALDKGLTGLRRRRARIQLASTLRNNGKIEESIQILREERSTYSDELDDAVDSFLALSLSSAGKHKEALSLALKALSKHLPRYNNSLSCYAENL
ncbi:tetratricopeptide (TPR) repeat protein [Chryseobacterium bernardetii]|uniref:Tetratricopeptide repeat protein n=2 Tax=Chryseobacterium TaxID=59732 RepID=A0A543EGB5_9FLAO|nr:MULTISPECIES: tetratricopeptide repeat protein [Chryseobacterium]MDR6370639.1 tetratricopeptide (TPR) repeat protein [Chryseobacterium vietnamense]MDR6441645.1 tetratricopeptide (TPR) repeat protein [Chryseobacterium bernardetii]TQM20597.1 tetratricopeptide repeat protein [Chryseobacterium aquifrigidense]